MESKRILLRQSKGVSKTQETVKYSLDDLFDIFIKTKKAEGRSKRTISDYTCHIEFFARWLKDSKIDASDASNFDVTVFRSYVAHMTERLAPKTINSRLITLKTMFKLLTDEGILSTNPLQRVKIVKEPRDTVNSYTEDEISKLMAQPDQRSYVGFRDYVMMTVMLDCGLRINEIQSLLVQNVDFQYRQITISGENSKNRFARILPMSKQTWSLLKELVNENLSHFSTDLVFVTYEGEPLSYSGIYSNFKRYARQAGLKDTRVTLHKFRHTFAKMFILNGGDPFHLQRMLGHSSLDMTRRYIQLDTEDLRHQHSQFSPIASLLSGKNRRR